MGAACAPLPPPSPAGLFFISREISGVGAASDLCVTNSFSWITEPSRERYTRPQPHGA